VLTGWLELGGDDLAENGYPRDVYLRAIDEHYEQHAAVGRTLAARFAELAKRRAG
jgi:hypothetical protein